MILLNDEDVIYSFLIRIISALCKLWDYKELNFLNFSHEYVQDAFSSYAAYVRVIELFSEKSIYKI
jgi:hypothetical protein